MRLDSTAPPEATHRQSWWRAAVLIAGGAIVLYAMAARRPTPFPPDLHARLSLELAVNRALCDAPSHVASGQLSGALLAVPLAQAMPLRTFIRQQFGTLQAYCAAQRSPFVNNENSLMLLESWLLEIAPREMSLDRVFSVMAWCRCAVIIAFATALLWSGINVRVAVAAVLLSGWTLQQTMMFWASIYVFLFIDILLLVAFYLSVLRAAPRPTLGIRVAAGSCAGVLTAFATNMRTSHAPIFLLFFALFAMAWNRDRGRTFRSRDGVVLIGAFLAGFAIFQYVFILRERPAQTLDNVPDLTYHTVAHPLVLGLGVPPNALSREERIDWNDATAGEIAHRTDPSSQYLGAGYDAALFRFYAGLWRRKPREMLDTYYEKFRYSARSLIDGMIGADVDPPWIIAVALRPLTWVPDGLWLLAAGIGLTGVTWRRYWTHGSLPAFAYALMSAAASLMMIESGIIFSRFSVMYYGYLLFFAPFILLAGYDAIAVAVWRRVRPGASIWSLRSGDRGLDGASRGG